jgi:hypothetical protein
VFWFTTGHPGSLTGPPQSPPNSLFFEQAMVTVTVSVWNGFQFVQAIPSVCGTDANIVGKAPTEAYPVWEYE